MEYRVKYIFKGTRDKGIEIMDAYGDYQVYELLQEGEAPDRDTIVEEEAPDINISYEMKFNPHNKQVRKMVRGDEEHQVMDVYTQVYTDISETGLIGGMWCPKKMEQRDYDNDPITGNHIVGTEMANFLNFGIDRFMNGGYQLYWKSNEYDLQDTLMGRFKTEGHDLSDLRTRGEISKDMVHASMAEKETERIPYFIRMFGCKFINSQTWEYDMQEVELIKSLQERLRVFCEKVFFPADENDKRTNFERYCDNIEKIDKKELRSRVPKDWITPANIEHALSYECYAMIKGNVNFFKCGNCGLYTASSDNRARLCSRLVYDGTVEEARINLIPELSVYHYLCKEDQYIRNTRAKASSNLITNVTDYEKKRLYHHITTHDSLYAVQDKLVMGFGDIVFRHEEEYQDILEKAENEVEAIKIANDYMKLIAESMNEYITLVLGKAMKKEYLFTRKKNLQIKSASGNIFE